MKIAFVHDYLNQYGGAERVLQVLTSMFPNAPVYALVYDREATGGVFNNRVIRTSFLQHLPWTKKHHHLFSPLMPLAVEQFDASAFDVVLSVASSFAKGIITQSYTRHVCYCLTPPRFLWDDSQRFVDEFRYPKLIKRLVPPFLSYLRIWDHQAAMRVERFVAISDFVKERIAKYYGRESTVIYPPVNISKFFISAPGDYFIMVGRLVTYKRFDLGVRVFSRFGWPLKIVGSGVELDNLKRIAGPNVQFLGQIEDRHLAELYSKARALIFPQEEDFGIVPLEAMASGRPVIAFRGGGASETVIEGSTGLFFNEQTEDSLARVLGHFNWHDFDPAVCRAQAARFDIPVFRHKITELLKNTSS